MRAAKKCKPPKARPTGRPPKTLTSQQWAKVVEMAKAMCSIQEIADYLGLSKPTLINGPEIKDRFLAITKQAAAETRLKVRQKQLDLAMQGQPVGSIWWGKQHLGQTDRNTVSMPESGPLDQIQGAAQRLGELLDKLAKRQGATPS